MKTYGLILKGAGLTIIGLAVSKLISYIVNIIVARIGSTELGLLNLGFSVVSFIAMISLLGMHSGLVRYVSYYLGKKNKQKIKGIILDTIKIPSIIGLIAFILILIFNKTIAINIFHKPDLARIIAIFAFAIPFLILTEIFVGIFVSFKKIQYNIIIRDIGDKLARLILIVIFLALGFSLIGVVFAYLIAIIVTFALLFYFIRKREFILFDNKIKAVFTTKELLFYSFPLTLSSILTLLQKWADVFMLGYYKTASDVGVYNVSFSTSALLAIIPSALMALFIPIITGLYAQNKPKEIKLINCSIFKWITVINLLFASILIIFGKILLRIVFGPEYIQGYSALVILAISYLILSLTHIYSNNLLMVKKTKLVSFLVFISTLVNIVLNIALIPRYGINGAAMATLFSTIIFLTIMAFSASRIIKLKLIETDFIKILFAGILNIMIIGYLYKILSDKLFILVILILLTFLIYFVLLIMLKCFSKEDIRLIKNIKNKLSKKLNINIFSGE